LVEEGWTFIDCVLFFYYAMNKKEREIEKDEWKSFLPFLPRMDFLSLETLEDRDARKDPTRWEDSERVFIYFHRQLHARSAT
jgi:hypothetical protein